MNCEKYKSKNKIIKKCDYKLNEEENCNIIKRNSFVEVVMGYINYFMCLEYKKLDEKKKYKLQKKIIDKVYSLLEKKNNFLVDIELWKLLYGSSVNLYKYENNLIYNNNINNKIPIYQVTKHNHCLSNIINEILNNKKIKTIIHFDTHSDMNLVEFFKKIDKNYNNIIKKNDVKPYISKNEKLVWDIGAHMTASIYFMHKFYNINDGININWIVPDWVPIKQLDPIEQVEKESFKHKNIYLGSEDDMLSYMKKNEVEDIIEINFKRQRFNSIDRYKELIKFIDNKEYILDIDLDYFVANGEILNQKKMKQFIKYPYDVASTYRYKIRNNKNESPRDPFYGEKHESDVIKMQREVKFIKKRMDYFLRGIKYMKKNKIKPLAIIICDSTMVNFSNCLDCFGESNCYVPQEYALWIHRYIRKGLEEIFY
jgi:hypothetical protein